MRLFMPAFTSNRLRKYSRQLHLWFSLTIFLPVVIVIVSGLLLQIKKQSDWVQPPTVNLGKTEPVVSFDSLLEHSRSVAELNVSQWQDIKRLDVRPGKGIVKVQSRNGWEAQLSLQDGHVQQVAYRRSDTIEAIHDGSWFFEGANLWLFLPAAILLLVLWMTGGVMLWHVLKGKYRQRQQRR